VRKYDYETGRFTSTDVLWEKYAGWSPYHYCGNNPISRVDWNGKLITDSKGNYLFIPISVPEELTHPSGDQALMIRGIMFANNGTPIEAFENVSNKDGWDSDCHGTTFAGGQYWINNDQVDRILTGDKFKKDPKKSKIGDKVVYYGPDGKPVHSMTISNISPDKKITVKGEGGLESELKEMSIEDAWYPGSEYHIFRPTSKNKKVSNELIKKITNEVCNQVEEN